MLLDLSEIVIRQGMRVDYEVNQPSVEDPDLTFAAPLKGRLTFDNGGDLINIHGGVDTVLTLACSRCLEPFEVPVDAAFELRYLPQGHNTGEGEREIEEDDLTTAYYRDGALDVIDLMREQFQLALPMKPLCSDACRGLCPDCGANLNRTTCGCAPRWEDPRLAPLKGLLDRQKEN